jgi:hypothetical protein
MLKLRFPADETIWIRISQALDWTISAWYSMHAWVTLTKKKQCYKMLDLWGGEVRRRITKALDVLTLQISRTTIYCSAWSTQILLGEWPQVSATIKWDTRGIHTRTLRAASVESHIAAKTQSPVKHTLDFEAILMGHLRIMNTKLHHDRDRSRMQTCYWKSSAWVSRTSSMLPARSFSSEDIHVEKSENKSREGNATQVSSLVLPGSERRSIDMFVMCYRATKMW